MAPNQTHIGGRTCADLARTLYTSPASSDADGLRLEVQNSGTRSKPGSPLATLLLRIQNWVTVRRFCFHHTLFSDARWRLESQRIAEDQTLEQLEEKLREREYAPQNSQRLADAWPFAKRSNTCARARGKHGSAVADLRADNAAFNLR